MLLRADVQAPALPARVELLPHQLRALQAFDEGCDWVGMITGSGAGKSWFGARWLVSRATRFPEGFHLGTEPSDDQLALVMIPAIRDALDELGIEYRFRATAEGHKVNRFELAGGGMIWVRTASNIDLKRGVEIDSWWADEARDYKRRVFEVTMPGRIRGRKCDVPQVLVTTTPNGFDHVYARFGQSPQIEGHRLIHARSRDNWHNRADFVPKLLRNVDPEIARQEEGGEFIGHEGRVYKAFSREDHVRKCRYDPAVELWLCFDFNVTPFICEVVQPRMFVVTEIVNGVKVRRIEPGAHTIGEICLRPGSIRHMAKAIKDRYGDHDGEVLIFGDSTGHGRHAQTGKSSYQMLVAALDRVFPQGVALEVPKDQPGVIDRINATNWAFRNGFWQVHHLVDESCTELIKDLEQVRWDDNDRIDKEDKKRTHASDALGYCLVRRFRPGEEDDEGPEDYER